MVIRADIKGEKALFGNIIEEYVNVSSPLEPAPDLPGKPPLQHQHHRGTAHHATVPHSHSWRDFPLGQSLPRKQQQLSRTRSPEAQPEWQQTRLDEIQHGNLSQRAPRHPWKNAVHGRERHRPRISGQR